MRGCAVGFIVALVIFAAASCGDTDPFGATTRERLRTEAAVRIAQTEAAAQVQTAATWASTLPVVAVVIVAGVLAGIVLYFRGRAYLSAVERGPQGALPSPSDAVHTLRLYAERTNQRLSVHEGQYYLTDRATGKTVKALPKRSAALD